MQHQVGQIHLENYKCACVKISIYIVLLLRMSIACFGTFILTYIDMVHEYLYAFSNLTVNAQLFEISEKKQ